MGKIIWNEHFRRYETGVDRGVLYPHSGPGVAWNGLQSIETGLNVSEPESVYLDGVKVSETTSMSQFEATLKAYTYPDEFSIYDGVEKVGNGVYVDGQRTRCRFHLSYRTLINGGPEYRIHLLYNLTATPAGFLFSTTSTSIEPTSMVWKLTGVPVSVAGRRPTCHVMLESSEIDSDDLSYIEGVLYGSDNLHPSILHPNDLLGSRIR